MPFLYVDVSTCIMTKLNAQIRFKILVVAHIRVKLFTMVI